jgi:hypothetical protein
LFFGRRGEGEVARVGQQLLGLDQAVDLSSRSSSCSDSASVAESAIDIRAEVRLPWLECASSMMIAKRRPAMLAADLVEDERELLHGRDDDLLATLDEPAAGPPSARRGRPWS